MKIQDVASALAVHAVARPGRSWPLPADRLGQAVVEQIGHDDRLLLGGGELVGQKRGGTDQREPKLLTDARAGDRSGSVGGEAERSRRVAVDRIAGRIVAGGRTIGVAAARRHHEEERGEQAESQWDGPFHPDLSTQQRTS